MKVIKRKPKIYRAFEEIYEDNEEWFFSMEQFEFKPLKVSWSKDPTDYLADYADKVLTSDISDFDIENLKNNRVKINSEIIKKMYEAARDNKKV